MAKNIQSLTGMNDILPDKTPAWQYLEETLCAVLTRYGYHEIRLPLVEETALFKRSIGEVTDIVEKEMYTFDDRDGTSITLRPEGTAGCVRAGIERGLLFNQIQRLWYAGPMFRHEKPQKERYRQFHQIGVEVFGLNGPDIDAEIILMNARFWRELGLRDVTLELNSLGDTEARQAHREALLNYLTERQAQLDADSQRRLLTNPLRILDSKNPDMQGLIEAAPQLQDYLDAESRRHFETLCQLLDKAGVAYTVNPRLVRGLDYYNRTVFEWTTRELGAQSTICAGGRYDGLVAQLGGKPSPAVGFALGLERVVALLEKQAVAIPDTTPHAYLLAVGEAAMQQAPAIAEHLRDALPDLRLLMHCGGGSFKSQFKRADKSGAPLALVLGESEVSDNTLTLKFLREDKPQQTVGWAEAVAYLGTNLVHSNPEGVAATARGCAAGATLGKGTLPVRQP